MKDYLCAIAGRGFKDSSNQKQGRALMRELITELNKFTNEIEYEDFLYLIGKYSRNIRSQYLFNSGTLITCLQDMVAYIKNEIGETKYNAYKETLSAYISHDKNAWSFSGGEAKRFQKGLNLHLFSPEEQASFNNEEANRERLEKERPRDLPIGVAILKLCEEVDKRDAPTIFQRMFK